MPLMRLQEIFAALRAGGRLNAEDWALITELGAIYMAIHGLPPGKPKSQKDSVANEQHEDYAARARGEGYSISSILLEVLDKKHAKALIDHRKRMKKPLSEIAAERLTSKLSEARDANAAVELMLERGWVGFDIEWKDAEKLRKKEYVSGPKRTWAEIKAELDRDREDRWGGKEETKQEQNLNGTGGDKGRSS